MGHARMSAARKREGVLGALEGRVLRTRSRPLLYGQGFALMASKPYPCWRTVAKRRSHVAGSRPAGRPLGPGVASLARCRLSAWVAGSPSRQGSLRSIPGDTPLASLAPGSPLDCSSARRERLVRRGAGRRPWLPSTAEGASGLCPGAWKRGGSTERKSHQLDRWAC